MSKTMFEREKDILEFLELNVQFKRTAIWTIWTKTDEFVSCHAEDDFDFCFSGRALDDILSERDDEQKLNLFIERFLYRIKTFKYGLDVNTLEPKKIVQNPFFGMNCLEEACLHLDLLRGPCC